VTPSNERRAQRVPKAGHQNLIRGRMLHFLKRGALRLSKALDVCGNSPPNAVLSGRSSGFEAQVSTLLSRGICNSQWGSGLQRTPRSSKNVVSNACERYPTERQAFFAAPEKRGWRAYHCPRAPAGRYVRIEIEITVPGYQKAFETPE